jgi:D-aspartate ligase
MVPAIVIGLCNHGLHLTRNFIAHGISVYVIYSDNESFSAKTRYGKKIYCENPYSNNLIKILVDLAKNFNDMVPIFPTNDKMVDNLMLNWDELKDYYKLPFGLSDDIWKLKNKAELYKIALDHDLNVPFSITIETLKDALEHKNRMIFPVAVKPVLPLGSFKAIQCDSFEQLLAQVKKSEQISEPILAQEWIPGDERQLYFCGYYINSKGECLAEFSGRKLICYPDFTGNSAATEPHKIPALNKEGYDFFKSIEYWGLCSIEYKLLENNSAIFIEVTVGRTDWWLMCATTNGINIPIAAYNDLTGNNIPFKFEHRRNYIVYDLERTLPVIWRIWRNKEWNLKENLIFLIRRKKEVLFSFTDPKSFICLVLNLIKIIGGKLALCVPSLINSIKTNPFWLKKSSPSNT